VWNRPDADVSTGRTVMDDLGRQGLYRRIYQPGKDGRLREIEDYARNIINVKRLLEPENSVVMAEINIYAVYSRLEVVVENGYRLPVGRFLGLFGADDTFTLKVEAWAVIDDPSELIRNADFIIDIEKELEDKYPGLKSFSEKTQDVFRDIKGKITGFLD